jgi:uncharacterized protein YkwD
MTHVFPRHCGGDLATRQMSLLVDAALGRVRTGAVAGTALIASAVLLTAPTAHADPLDNLRGAVNGARAQSTCPALTYSGQLEAAAQEYVRTADALGSIKAPNFEVIAESSGYPGQVRDSIASGDPTSNATAAMMGNASGKIKDCSLTEFGVGMVRDDVIDTSYVAVVFGRPPAPKPVEKPAPDPAQAKTATVVGGDADIFNIAHNEVPDPNNGVRGVKLGTLRNGQQVTLAAGGPCRPSDWCKIVMPDDPAHFGFVFGQLAY